MSVGNADMSLDGPGPYEPHGFTRRQILCLARQILAFRQINIRINAMRDGVSFNEEELKRPVRAAIRQRFGIRSGVLPRSHWGKGMEDDADMIVDDKVVVDAPSSAKTSSSSSSSSEEEEDVDSDVTTEDCAGASITFNSSDGDDDDDDKKNDNKTGFATGNAHGPPATIATSTRVRRSSRAVRYEGTFEESNLSESSGGSDEEEKSVDKETTNRQSGDGGEQCGADAAVSQRPQHASARKASKKRKISMIEADGDRCEKGQEVRLPPLNSVKVRWYENEEEATCSVCGEGEAVEDNLILLCEGWDCTVAVHQSCYGVKIVPEGKWLCDACIARREGNTPRCAVCPIVGGALRRVHSVGRVVPVQRPAFVHLACALWTPEMMLQDPDNMDKVDISKLSASRVALNCEACGQSGGGTVQCSYGTCCRAFHVLCGRFGGQDITFAMDGSPLAFCSVHSRPRYGPARRLLARCLKVNYEDDEAQGNEGTTVPAKLSEYEMQRQAQLRRVHEARERIFSQQN